MAQPLQYQSQFIPTDFNTIGNMLGMYRQDMQQRNQEFEQAGAMQDKAISEIYGMKTLDPELFKNAGDSLTKAIDEAVSKRGGDYGAAASDISRLISREAKNPIYGLNQRKLEQVAQLEHMLARNPNLLALEDPRKISLSKQGLTPEDIKYSVADPADIQKSINDIFGDRAKQIREGGLQKSKTPGYLEAITTKGLTTQEMQELLQDPSTREALLARMPQLQGHIDDPNVASWFNNQMQQGMQGLVGGSQRQFVRDLNYEGRVVGQEGSYNSSNIGTPYFTPPEVKAKIDNNINRDTKYFEDILDSNGNVDYNKRDTSLPKNTTEKSGTLSYPYYRKSNESTAGQTHKKGFDVFDDLKDTYSALYNSFKDKGLSDKEFANTAMKLKRDEAYVAETNLRLNNVSFTDNISRITDNVSGMLLNNKGKEVDYEKYNKQFKDSGLTPGDLSAQITPRGEIKLQDPKGERYTLNPKHLSAPLKHYTSILNNLYDSFYNYKVSGEDINKINNNVIPLDNLGNYVGTYIDPDNPLERRIIIYRPSETGELVPYAQMNNFMQLHGNIIKFIDEDLNKTRRNPKASNE